MRLALRLTRAPLVLGIPLVTLVLLVGCEDEAATIEQATFDAGSVQNELSEVNGTTSSTNALDISNYDEKRGRTVFTRTCVDCHDKGVNAAPRLGDAAAWAARLERGVDILARHAQHGYGRMPAQCGLAGLSDADVAAAVAYAVARHRRALSTTGADGRTVECHPLTNPVRCDKTELRNAVSLYLFLLLSGRRLRLPQPP